jgi:hypothetical protein
MAQNIGTLVSIAVAILLVLVALLVDFRTAAMIAGIYLIGFAVHRLIKSRKQT